MFNFCIYVHHKPTERVPSSSHRDLGMKTQYSMHVAKAFKSVGIYKC
jgi:hypothetical protein